MCMNMFNMRICMCNALYVPSGHIHIKMSPFLPLPRSPLPQPATPQVFTQEAGRKWGTMPGEGLGLTVWALSQYGVTAPHSDMAWWEGFWRRSEMSWGSVTRESLGLLLVGLAELVATAPERWAGM